MDSNNNNNIMQIEVNYLTNDNIAHQHINDHFISAHRSPTLYTLAQNNDHWLVISHKRAAVLSVAFVALGTQKVRGAILGQSQCGSKASRCV